jgi:hypothetical protein
VGPLNGGSVSLYTFIPPALASRRLLQTASMSVPLVDGQWTLSAQDLVLDHSMLRIDASPLCIDTLTNKTLQVCVSSFFFPGGSKRTHVAWFQISRWRSERSPHRAAFRGTPRLSRR